jgi:hypothetical protein
MRNTELIRPLALLTGVLALAFLGGCKGPTGDTGANGTDGTDGVDGNEVCLECHNLTVKSDVTAQYMTSIHAAGDQVAYAGGRKGCAMCHSDQGFIETQYTGQDTTAYDIALPQEVQCQTCHSFHQSLDFENEGNAALRAYGPVDLLMYRAADPMAPPVTIDLGGSGNLCANCHQPRRLGPVMAAGVPVTDSTYVSSSHYGPHHGPQTTSLAGLGASEIGTGYPAPGTGSVHATSTSCVTCHMHEGDHAFEPTLASCNTMECHNGALTTMSDNSRQNTFKTLMATLESKLMTAGLLDAAGHPVKGTYPSDQVAALYNYEWMLDDRSNGVHNFPYLETLLTNSIAVF